MRAGAAGSRLPLLVNNASVVEHGPTDGPRQSRDRGDLGHGAILGVAYPVPFH